MDANPLPSPIVTVRRARWGYTLYVDEQPVLRVASKAEAERFATMLRESMAEDEKSAAEVLRSARLGR
jgi:hypothetical protein